MKLIFLGTGSAFTIGEDNYHSNMVVQSDDGKNLLLDCGSDIRMSLTDQGLCYKDISDIFISHLHGDHVGGLEWLAFNTMFDPSCGKPTLHISEMLVEDIWNKVLSGGLGSLQGTVATLETYFNVEVIPKNAGFTWEGVHFQLVQTVHFMNGFTLSPSFGLIFEINGKKAFLTADTQFLPNIMTTFYEQADLIFHDCQTTEFKAGVHAHYCDLCTLPAEIKKKMWLYHYNPGKTQKPKQDGFLGFVKKGQSFEF